MAPRFETDDDRIAPISMEGDGVTIRIDPMPAIAPKAPVLVIEGAQWLAETFFRRDPSAAGPHSYDSWIQSTQADDHRRDRIVDDDITAVNSTMAARTSHSTWQDIISATDWSWLVALDTAWDLFEISDDEWERSQAAGRLRTAFSCIQRPGLQLAVITKVLHIKRPKLIPVLDSLVLAQIGGRVSEDVLSWVRVTEHVRNVGRANVQGLDAIRQHLRTRGIAERSRVRVLDALLWTCTPGSALFSSLSEWERRFRPREAAKQ